MLDSEQFIFPSLSCLLLFLICRRRLLIPFRLRKLCFLPVTSPVTSLLGKVLYIFNNSCF